MKSIDRHWNELNVSLILQIQVNNSRICLFYGYFMSGTMPKAGNRRSMWPKELSVRMEGPLRDRGWEGALGAVPSTVSLSSTSSSLNWDQVSFPSFFLHCSVFLEEKGFVSAAAAAATLSMCWVLMLISDLALVYWFFGLIIYYL